MLFSKNEPIARVKTRAKRSHNNNNNNNNNNSTTKVSLSFAVAVPLLWIAFTMLMTPSNVVASSASNLTCPQSNCGPYDYCELTAPNASSFECKSCQDCRNAGPVQCPQPQCFACISNDDCFDGRFCEFYENYAGTVTTSCSSCIDCVDDAYSFSFGQSYDTDACLDNCLCQSSDDCPDGFICSTRGLDIPNGQGVCDACVADEQIGLLGCLSDWLVGPNETCSELCPD